MNDFTSLLLALGRGLIKILISALVGFGVALLLIGLTTAGKNEIWRQPGPPGELFIGIGAGLLSGGIIMLLLFLLPWLFKRAPEPRYEQAISVDRPPSERTYLDDQPNARPPPPPRAEPGESNYYSK